MATREELKKLSNETFYDNNEGLISPDGHRKYNNTMIDAMALGTDLTTQAVRIDHLEAPDTPAHARGTVVDEVCRGGFLSWERSKNHVLYIPKDRDFGYLPIGEIRYHYYENKSGVIVRDTEKTKYFGPAVKPDAVKDYFVVHVSGEYLLMVKSGTGSVIRHTIKVTVDQAKAGYKIDFDDEINLAPDISGLNSRTHARLFYTNGSDYQGMRCSLPGGIIFKNTTDINNKSPEGVVLGISMQVIKNYAPVMTRNGDIIETGNVVRNTLNLRPTIIISSTEPITLDTFAQGSRGHYRPQDYIIRYKKSKSLQINKIYQQPKRKTKNIVGYVPVWGRCANELTGRLKCPVSAGGFAPNYIDFQIVQNDAEKRVIAKYRGTMATKEDAMGFVDEIAVALRRM